MGLLSRVFVCLFVCLFISLYFFDVFGCLFWFLYVGAIVGLPFLCWYRGLLLQLLGVRVTWKLLAKDREQTQSFVLLLVVLSNFLLHLK